MMSFNLLLHILQSDKSYQPNFLEIPWNQKYCQKIHDDRYLEKYTKCGKKFPKYINDKKTITLICVNKFQFLIFYQHYNLEKPQWQKKKSFLHLDWISKNTLDNYKIIENDTKN